MSKLILMLVLVYVRVLLFAGFVVVPPVVLRQALSNLDRSTHTYHVPYTVPNSLKCRDIRSFVYRVPLGIRI